MNTNERNTDARSQVKVEGTQGLNNPQGGQASEISLVQATAGLHILL